MEASRHPRPKACAEYASPRIAEELAAVGVDRAEWQRAAVAIDAMTVFAPGAPIELRYGDRRGPRSAWGVDRPSFDALLARHAAACGAEVLEATRLVSVRRAPPASSHGHAGAVVGGRLTGPDGEIDVEATLLVGADGARSRTALELGVERTVRWPRRLGLVAHYRGVAELASRAEMHVGDGFYIGLAPTPNGELNVGMALPLDGAEDLAASRRFDNAIAALPAVADRLRASSRVTRITGMAPIGHRVRDVAGPGWLLVGDAAGFVDPFTGEGIYRALRGARAAQGAVEAALEGADAAAVADRYRAERRRAFAAKDAVTWLVQGFLAAPPLFRYAAERLQRRDASRLRLASVLGDLRPATHALSPAFLAGVLRP